MTADAGRRSMAALIVAVLALASVHHGFATGPGASQSGIAHLHQDPAGHGPDGATTGADAQDEHGHGVIDHDHAPELATPCRAAAPDLRAAGPPATDMRRPSGPAYGRDRPPRA